MKNADKPISPGFSITAESGNEILATPEAANRGMVHHANIGLTKREYFAGLTIQGLLAANNGLTNLFLVKKAITIADELLNELENSKEN